MRWANFQDLGNMSRVYVDLTRCYLKTIFLATEEAEKWLVRPRLKCEIPLTRVSDIRGGNQPLIRYQNSGILLKFFFSRPKCSLSTNKQQDINYEQLNSNFVSYFEVYSTSQKFRYGENRNSLMMPWNVNEVVPVRFPGSWKFAHRILRDF